MTDFLKKGCCNAKDNNDNDHYALNNDNLC